MIRAQPMDAVVLMGGCDKTVPAQLMGAVSAGRPAIMLVAGPMMTGRHRGERLGACTDCRRFWARYRAGEVDRDGDLRGRGQARRHGRHLRRDGHRLDHGLHRRGARHDPARHGGDPGRARRPAARRRGDRRGGGAAHRLAAHARQASSTRKSVENALRVLLALGGSTNAVIHLTAIAGRAGVERVARRSSTSCRIRRRCWSTSSRSATATWRISSRRGGMGALMRELKPLLHLDCMTVTGETLGERLTFDARRLCGPHDHRGERSAA